MQKIISLSNARTYYISPNKDGAVAKLIEEKFGVTLQEYLTRYSMGTLPQLFCKKCSKSWIEHYGVQCSGDARIKKFHELYGLGGIDSFLNSRRIT